MTAQTTMRAVELTALGGPEVLVPVTRPTPLPDVGEFLVRVGACGVCGHDALARRGELAAKAGAVLGHEVAGTVVAAGSKDLAGWVGRRVALNQRLPCGSCPDCTVGRPSACREGRGFYGEDLPGGYAEFVVAAPSNAVVVPDSVDDTLAAILSCAVGTGLRALRAAQVDAGQIVVVTGAGGGVGLHTVAVARLLGAHVVAVTGSAAKGPELYRRGAAAVVSPDRTELRDAISALGGRRGADVAVEVTGGPTFALALRSLAPGGCLVLVGNTEPDVLPLDPGLTILKELRVQGSAHADRDDLVEVVDLVASGRLETTPPVRWALDDAVDAHTALDARTVTGRGVLVP